MFHRLWQAKFTDDSSILSSNQFSAFPTDLKMKRTLKVVKIDSKINISLSRSKSVKPTTVLVYIMPKYPYGIAGFQIYILANSEINL